MNFAGNCVICICFRVCGSYEDMKFGWVSEALKDFTGGVHMTLIPQNENPLQLWDLIHRAARANSLMGCGTPGNVNTLITTAS